MGFRHLHGFNLAMLGKQGWKLLTATDTTLYKVFKAKYYPNGGFLDANLGHNPSYIWRSIHASQVIVKAGMRWRIGDGSSINVWKDPWLRDPLNPYIQSNAPPGLENLTVQQLLSTSQPGWNTTTLQQILSPYDRERVLNIPVLAGDSTDSIIWGLSRNGRYSVKTAYHHVVEVIADSSHLHIPGNWENIWQLNIPKKVRIFLWRVLRNCLPTRSLLATRGVNCPQQCVICGDGVENDEHIFFSCPCSIMCWQRLGLMHAITSARSSQLTPKDLIFSLLESLAGPARISFVMTLWAIWHCRNQILWEDANWDVEGVLRRAADAQRDWEMIHGGALRAPRSVPQQEIRWRKPNGGTLKCNTDAAIFQNRHSHGLGWVVRNSGGEVISAATVSLPGVPLPHEAEAACILAAAKWAAQQGLSQVCFESDCLQAVQSINGHNDDVSSFGCLITSIKHIFQSFNSFTVSYVRRQANCVAHKLARAAQFYAGCHFFENVPSCIASIVLNEMS